MGRRVSCCYGASRWITGALRSLSYGSFIVEEAFYKTHSLGDLLIVPFLPEKNFAPTVESELPLSLDGQSLIWFSCQVRVMKY